MLNLFRVGEKGKFNPLVAVSEKIASRGEKNRKLDTFVRNLKTIRETTLGSRDVDVVEIKDEAGNPFGKAVRFTVTLKPDYHPSIKELSFMVFAGEKADELAGKFNSGSGKIKVYEYSAGDATRHVAQVFSYDWDKSGIFAMPCPEPTTKS